MTPSLSVTETPTEFAPKSGYPWVWLGFMFALAFLILETLMVALELEEQSTTAGLTLIAIGGFVYWLVCLHRFHKILLELTHGRYPISAAEAVGKHFIPFYNIYWVFAWPSMMSHYINARGRVRMMPGFLVGLMLFLSLILRYFDGGLGLLILFGTTVYISSKLKQHVRAVTAALPENLPPVLDPQVFSAPAGATSGPPTLFSD
ncbi:MAG TPA: hypothetical protein VLA93_14345 [Pyrinomonadaceae bacterium]|nr:hypothetical protein [Pyrinomonadaceae bacterium]